MTAPVRIIPCLLLQDGRLASTTRFQLREYLGDPIDAVRKLSRAGADEIILLDIAASRVQAAPDLGLVARISDVSCTPVTCGGGVRSLHDIRALRSRGAEKVLIGTRAAEDPAFVGKASGVFGSHGIVVAIDARRLPGGGYVVCAGGGIPQAGLDPVSHARDMEAMGAGEIFLNSVDNDGGLGGYDLRLVRAVARAVGIPVIACGGAGNIDDIRAAIHAGASAAAASSLILYRGCRGTTHVSYPAGPESALAEGR